MIEWGCNAYAELESRTKMGGETQTLRIASARIKDHKIVRVINGDTKNRRNNNTLYLSPEAMTLSIHQHNGAKHKTAPFDLETGIPVGDLFVCLVNVVVLCLSPQCL